HARRIAAGFADLADARADQDSLFGDQHQLIIIADGTHADDVTITVGGLDVDDAFAAATNQSVILDRCALAKAVDAGGQHHALDQVLRVRGDDHRNEGITFFEFNSFDASRRPAHRPHV